VENEAARPGRNGSRGADRGLEARPCPSGVCAANHVLSGLSRWFSKQVSPIHHSLGLSPSRMERCPSLHCQPCFLQNFETVKFPPENILECSGMCVFDTSSLPTGLFFVSRRRDLCWSSCGSWPSWRGTLCMCCTRSAPSSCTTGEVVAGGWGLCWAWGAHPSSRAVHRLGTLLLPRNAGQSPL
jgi:hypothetical protein